MLVVVPADRSLSLSPVGPVSALDAPLHRSGLYLPGNITLTSVILPALRQPGERSVLDNTQTRGRQELRQPVVTW